jgi:solute carrier family 25 (adenine nucleotide translocator) protein 4/5/6/31
MLNNYYGGALDCVRRVLIEEGPRGFFNGLSANLIRGISGAILLVGYDEVKKIVFSQ